MDSTSHPVEGLPPPARLRAALTAVARDPAAREIARRFRSLAGEGRAVIACSGGADSSALALVIGAHNWTDRSTYSHVLHDMRPRGAAEADRDFVRALAVSLGGRFEEREVAVPKGENAEGAARRLRYGALTDIARAHGCGVVVTAHHADDQLETILLALIRGAGPKGMAGMRPRRKLSDGVTLVRPMLGVSRADCERICAIAGVQWRVDATNSDVCRARAAVRHRVLPVLEELRPGAAARAAHSANLLHDAWLLVDARTTEVFRDSLDWPRADLRAQTTLVVGEGLRRAFAHATSGAHKDRLPRRVVEQAVAHIRSNSGETKVFQWPRGVAVEVTRERVRLTPPC